MVDKAHNADSLRSAWRCLGQRVAVAGGSLVALVALLQHTPPSTAALRGGVTWLAVLAMTRLGGLALAHAHRFDLERAARLTSGDAERDDQDA